MSEFDSFFNYVKAAAEFMFGKKGEHIPLFFVQTFDEPGRIGLVSAAWKTITDKENKLALMRAAVEIGAVARCCLVHEMWFAKEVASREPVDVKTMVAPSQRSDREEMLMIIGIDKDQSRIGYWNINRPSKTKKPTLGRFELPPPDQMQALSGAFRSFTKSDGTRQ